MYISGTMVRGWIVYQREADEIKLVKKRENILTSLQPLLKNSRPRVREFYKIDVRMYGGLTQILTAPIGRLVEAIGCGKAAIGEGRRKS